MLIEIDDNAADMHIEAMRLGDNPEVLARRILGYWYLQGYNRGKAEGMKLAEERLASIVKVPYCCTERVLAAIGIDPRHMVDSGRSMRSIWDAVIGVQAARGLLVRHFGDHEKTQALSDAMNRALRKLDRLAKTGDDLLDDEAEAEAEGDEASS